VKFSFGNFLRRGTAEVPASGDKRLAQELVDFGIAVETSGDAAKAVQCYRKAIEADHAFAPAHMNLGIALQAAGEE
jgi:Flp pilus assembly protein TadD